MGALSSAFGCRLYLRLEGIDKVCVAGDVKQSDPEPFREPVCGFSSPVW